MREGTPVLKNFSSFMRNDINKTELFMMLVQSLTSITNPTIVASLEDIVTTDQTLNMQNLAPCNHKEADTRLFLQALSGSSCGYKKVSIVTVDTDVIVISLRHFRSMDLDELVDRVWH